MIDLEQLKINNFANEKQLQAAAVKLVHQQFPRLRDLFWHTENEDWKRRLAIKTDSGYRVETDEEFSLRCKIEGNQSKALGLLAGLMDLLFCKNGILYKLELKHINGKLSPAQDKLIFIFNQDCPDIPVVVANNLYIVYMFCTWIQDSKLTINFPLTFKRFEL